MVFCYSVGINGISIKFMLNQSSVFQTSYRVADL